MHKKAYKEGLTMKKWYRKTVTRTIVLVVAILSGALLVTNLLSPDTGGGMSLSQIQKMNTQSFEESEEFSKMVESYMYDVQEKLYLQNLLKVTVPTIRKNWWM